MINYYDYFENCDEFNSFHSKWVIILIENSLVFLRKNVLIKIISVGW